MIRVLAVSGSLRAASSNGAVVQAAAALAPTGVTVERYAGLAALPHFNPDLDRPPVPPAVADLRAAFAAADAVLISAPEYAHGVPGSLKNALDWLVSSGELMHKPVALVNASPHAKHARASLAETLAVMMAVLVPDASVTVPLPRNSMTVADIVAAPDLSAALANAVAALARATAAARAAAAAAAAAGRQ